MTYFTEDELTEHLKYKSGTVRANISHKKLRKNKNGRIDDEDSFNKKCIGNRRKVLKKKELLYEQEEKERYISGKSDQELLQEEIPENIDILSKKSAERLRVIAQIKQLTVRTEAVRNKLIDRDLLTRFVGKVYSTDSNELKTLGQNISPEIAALLAIDDEKKILEINKLIDKEMFKILRNVKRICNDFLKEIKAEELRDDEEEPSIF